MEEKDIISQSNKNGENINSESRLKLIEYKEYREENIFINLNLKDKKFKKGIKENNENKEDKKNNKNDENINKDENIIKNIKNEEKKKYDINYISEVDLSIIKSKIETLEQKYSFSVEYSKIILNFINFINDLLYEQINNSIKDNLNNISFFDKLSKLYLDLVNKLKISDEKKNNNIIKDSIIDISNLIANDFSTKSEYFRRNAEHFNQEIQKSDKNIEEIKKNILDKNNEINQIKNSLKKNYSENYIKLFLSEIKNTNVIELPDLVIAIIDLTKQINQLIRETNVFIEKEKESLIALNNMLNDINKNAKNIIMSFIKENKNKFSNELNKKIDEIEKKIEKYDPKEIFTFSQLLNNISQRNENDNILKKLYNLLGLSKNKEYKNIDSFFEFLIQKSPEKISITVDELIIQKFEVLYDPGLLRTWKDCFIFCTLQKHLIICDNKDILSFENIIKIFEMDKINFKLNSSFERPYMFEISPNYNNVIFKGYNTYFFDALNNKNFYELCQILKDYIINK